MTEIHRPASVREILECLPRVTLVYLCEFRGLPVARANADCRSSVARSFRGRRDEFLGALRKWELALLLTFPIQDGEERYLLPEPEAYSKRELVELACLSFGRTRELGRPFQPVPVGETVGPDLVPAEASEPPEAAAEEEGEDPLVAPESNPSLQSSADLGWSRRRSVRGLLTHLGLPIPDDFNQESFGRLIEALENRGYEIATVDGARLTPLHDALGIDDEVRLRYDALAVPTGPSQGRSGGSDDRAAPHLPALCDYARASLRLELLTAGFGGDASPALLDSCVGIAAAGLPIDESTRALLERVAKRLVRTRCEPTAVLTSLVQRLDREDGEVLLREYFALHRPDEELAGLLSDHWAALTGAAEESEARAG